MSPIITHIYTLVVALLYLLIVSATPIARKANQTHILARGSTTRTITSTPGGFLVKNGQETSCEIALIDNKAAFVAASCVSDANGNTDTSNSYQVYYNSGNSSPVSVSLPPSDISIHAYYNPSTFENNIAIIQFNSDKEVRWSNSIGVGTSGLSDAMLVRRYMSSLNSPEWTDPLTVTNSNAGSSCSTQSGLYAANTGDFVCSYQITEPLLNSMCGIPYGSVYSALNGIVAVSGLYSFSVISGSSFCSSSSTINYYTLLSNYIAFAKNVIGRDVSLVFDEGVSVNANILYTMRPESFSSPSGTSVITGDLFANGATGTNWIYGQALNQPANQNTANTGSNANMNAVAADAGSGSLSGGTPANGDSDNSNNASGGGVAGGAVSSGSNPADAAAVASNTVSNGMNPTLVPSADDFTLSSLDSYASSAGGTGITSGSNVGSHDTTGGSNRVNTNDAASENQASANARNGISGGEIAAIVICLLVGMSLMIGGLFLGSRWYRQRKLRKRWAPEAVRQMVEAQIVESELGNLENPTKFELPSYRQHRQTMLVAAGPTSPRVLA